MPDAPSRPGRWAWLRRSLKSFAILYVLVCVVMFVAQGWLTFHPTEQTDAQAQALTDRPDVEPLEIEVEDAVLRGVMLRGRGPGPRPTVLYFGGNAEAIARRIEDRAWVAARGWNLVLVSYRGYDRSSGSPSADDLLADVVTIFDAIAARSDVDAQHVVAWGFSLGTGVAARLAHQRELAGVILGAPYSRLSAIGAEQYPWLPVRWLFRNEIDTEAWVPEITEPVLILHGHDDGLIAPAHSQRLADAWKGPVLRRVLPGAGHNDLGRHAELRPAVEAFLDEHRPNATATAEPEATSPPQTETTTTPQPESTPSPASIVPTTKPPALIATTLAKLSPDRLRADIDALAGFGTRHTLSDDAPDRGIAAARRYIVAQLEAATTERPGEPLTVEEERFELHPDGRRIDRDVTLANVVAILPGTMPEAAARRIYVMGHYDSRASDVMDRQTDAPGANDDASGVALTMELARVLADQPLDATVVFMATAGEEQGLLGARHHAQAAAAANVQITGVLNNDIVGDPHGPDGRLHDDRIRVFSSDVSLALTGDALAQLRQRGALADGRSRQLARYVATIAAWERTPVQPTLVFRPDRFLRGGDHLAFDEQGYPAVRFTEVAEDYDRQHQDPRTEGERRFGDHPEHVDANYLAQVARLNGAVLIHLANAPSAPADAGVVATALTTDTTLRWSASPEPDVAGYEVVWRRTAAPAWEHQRDVGTATEHTLPLHKDDWVFGVRAYDRGGHRSPVAACGIVRR